MFARIWLPKGFVGMLCDAQLLIFFIMASAISCVPTAVGSSRFSFISYVTSLPSAITAATAFSSLSASVVFADMSQQQNAAEYQRGRIDLVKPFVFRCAAVRRLEYRGLFADICARRNAQSPYQPRAQGR